MRLLLVAAAAAFLLAPARGAQTLDTIVKARLAEAESPACLAVGVVRDGTNTAFACGAGAGTVSFDADSIFEIGSVTKGLTGLLLADMVVRGEVSLDDAAAKHSRPGARLPARGGREITLRDLVTHTAGLPRTPPGFAPRDPGNPYGHFDEDALYAALAEAVPTHDIGTQYNYSNLGFMWLSDILARRAATSYESLITERIFRPLGMSSSSIQPSREQQARVVKGHDGAYRIVAPWTIAGNLGGVGLVRSTLADMLKLAQALAGVHRTPLDAAIEEAIRPPAPSAAPDIGYAWNVHASESGRRFDHGGGTGGFVSHVAFDRGKKRASVVLADAAVPVADLALHLVDPSYHLRRSLVVVPLEPVARKQYVGTYAMQGLLLKIWEDGERLIAHATGQPIVEIVFQGNDAFFVRAADAPMVFTRGADGKVEGLALYLGGRQGRWRRVTE